MPDQESAGDEPQWTVRLTQNVWGDEVERVTLRVGPVLIEIENWVGDFEDVEITEAAGDRLPAVAPAMSDS